MYVCTVLISLHEYRFGRRIPHSAMMVAGGFTCLLVLAVPKGKSSFLIKLLRLLLFSTPEPIRRMVSSFRRNDFWSNLGGQALLMIGLWLPRILYNYPPKGR